MRLTLFDRSYASVPTGDLTGPDRGEAGADGEQWLRDMLQGGPDVNPELSGRQKFFVYDEMRKTSASVKSLLMFYKLTVRSASWSIDPHDTDPVSKVIRDMVAWNLGLDGEDGQLDLSWGKSLEQGLQMLEFGCMFEELVWGDVRRWRDADGDEHLVRPLARLAPRLPASVQKVEYGSDGRISRLTQGIANTRPIPGDKLSYLVFEPAPGTWDGVSLLRPAWGAWKLQKLLMISTGIGWDRYSAGTPVVWHPDTPEGAERARTIGRNVRTHQRAYVHLPVPQGGTKADSEWAIDILNAAQSLAEPSTLLRWCSEQIAEAGLQHFARQGLGQTGARASAETQADPFYLAAQVLAEDLALERKRQVVRQLVEVNFGREAADYRMPRLTVSKLRARNIDVIARAISLLEPAGFTFTDREAQDDVRDLLGLTNLPNDLEQHGIPRDRLLAALSAAGLDQAQLAAVVNSLPSDVGVARNTVPKEGAGLAA
ncbi:Protein of unknown function (DUF935) [Gaiella occulta]|uniref:Portal protein n=1 Tax=Gaiella occulta TaxID=1002870 RepID=A0A7M2YUK6_9ACTN|nr:hypothetical protein [Gaiella occulta]RDI73299.1 Protein of unknown function (DUF935) [Gaiella occulta]